MQRKLIALLFLIASTLPLGAAERAPLQVCLLSGSPDYESDASLTTFKKFLEDNYGASCTLLKQKANDDLPGLEALEHCDVAVFFTWRMKLAGEQLERIKKYCASGKPIVGVRTASHGIETWKEMDKDVLGGSYKGPYATSETTWPESEIKLAEALKSHPILKGVTPFKQGGSLYKNPELAANAEVLLTGAIPDHTEPVAWTRTHNGARVFYTSLGHKKDFQNESFRCLLGNAIFWAADRNPAPSSAYTDHKRLNYYIDENGREKPVKSKGDWAKRHKDILEELQQVMGPLPERTKKSAPAIKETIKGEGYSRLTIMLPVDGNDHVPAYLFVPDGIKKGERRPAMIALHQTDFGHGKGSPAGLAEPNMGYGQELARRGYVVLTPDFPTLGDYKPYDFAADAFVSGSMKGIVNHMYCVDYLQSRDDVDGKRIGAIGHSLGGHNSIFLGVFDERIKVIVSSCGWTPFHDYYSGKIAGWDGERYMPRLKYMYGLDADRVPFDFYELVAALAPRGFFSNSPLKDSNFEVDGVRKTIPKALEIFSLYHAADLLQVRYPAAEHDFPVPTRREAYEFIDRVLKHKPTQHLP